MCQIDKYLHVITEFILSRIRTKGFYLLFSTYYLCIFCEIKILILFYDIKYVLNIYIGTCDVDMLIITFHVNLITDMIQNYLSMICL